MVTNSKIKALKNCDCRQCKAVRGTRAGQLERKRANRRLRRLDAANEDCGGAVFVSTERS